MRAELRALGEHRVRVEDVLEPPDGGELLRLVAAVSTHDGEIEIDYEGTSPQVPYPVNAVFGVTLSGIHYVIRAATDPAIPMNEGCFRPVVVRAPLGTLLNPRRPAPVAGGNVETSQRNADLMLRAFAAIAPGPHPGALERHDGERDGRRRRTGRYGLGLLRDQRRRDGRASERRRHRRRSTIT